VITEVHDGPGVLPGRYAGPAIPIHSGPTPQQVARAEERAEADVLADRPRAAAGVSGLAAGVDDPRSHVPVPRLPPDPAPAGPPSRLLGGRRRY
jgi:hypothetical protein